MVFPVSVGLLALSAGVHRVLYGWTVRGFPWARTRRRVVGAAFVAVALLAPMARLLARLTHHVLATSLLAVSMLELMTVALGCIPLGLFYLGRAVATPRSLPPERPAQRETSPASPLIARRDAIERFAGLAAFGGAGMTFGWGHAIGRHAFVVEEVLVKIAGLPRALDGYTIAQVSDTHTGIFTQERELAEGFDVLARLRPDLVVATGDLVDFDPRWAPIFARKFAQIRARDGLYAVVGNHDYYTGVDEVLRTMRAAGITMLHNQGTVMRPDDGGGFALLGVDDLWARRSGGGGPDLERAIAMVPRDLPRILLAHQPMFFREAQGKVALQLSGHTHGGQINPGFCPASLFMQYVAGRYRGEGSTLWVNRGFGVAGPPARIGAPPEITKIVLVSA